MTGVTAESRGKASCSRHTPDATFRHIWGLVHGSRWTFWVGKVDKPDGRLRELCDSRYVNATMSTHLQCSRIENAVGVAPQMRCPRVGCTVLISWWPLPSPHHRALERLPTMSRRVMQNRCGTNGSRLQTRPWFRRYALSSSVTSCCEVQACKPYDVASEGQFTMSAGIIHMHSPES